MAFTLPDFDRRRYTNLRTALALPGSDRRVVLEADPAAGAGDLGLMVDEFLPAVRYPRSQLHITQATFALKYLPPGAERERTLTFDMSYPNATNRKNRPDDERAVGW